MVFARTHAVARGAGLALVAALSLGAFARGAEAGEARTVDPRLVREAIESRWAELAPASARLEVRSVPALHHRGGPATLDVTLPDDPTRPGPRALAVSCRIDGRTVARGLANVVVRVEVPVWTVTRPLVRGELLDASALVAETVSFDRQPVRLFRPEEGRRWRLVRDVAPGSRLRSVDVRAVPDVEAGDEITLVAQSGRARVTVPGRVRRSGDVGDTVLVHNPVTGAIVRAVLLDRNTALLVDAGTAATHERPRTGKGRGRS